MNVSAPITLSFLTFTIIAAFSTVTAYGQATKVLADKPSFEDLPSPDSSSGKNKNFRPKDWLEIEAKLKVSIKPEPLSKTCDKITVKWFIAVKNPDPRGPMLLLTKTIDHVNIPLDEDVYCSVYLSPASIKRITGFDRAAKSTVEYVGYEVLVNGVVIAAETNKGSSGNGAGGAEAWWNSTSNKISRSETVPLLNKSETPFSSMWWDRYAEISVDRR